MYFLYYTEEVDKPKPDSVKFMDLLRELLPIGYNSMIFMILYK